MAKTKLEAELAEAERKAWDSLARYKFVMFGYWAGVWVHLNRLQDKTSPNPFTSLVKFARRNPIQTNDTTIDLSWGVCRNETCSRPDGMFSRTRPNQAYCSIKCRNSRNVRKSRSKVTND